MTDEFESDLSVEESLRQERIRSLQLPPPPIVETGTSLRDALALMKSHKSGTVLVCTDGRLTGIFTERDVLMKLLGSDIDDREPVERYMTSDPHVLASNDCLKDAILLMTDGDYRHVPIVDPDRRPTGLLGARDIVDYIAEHYPAEVVNLPPRLHQNSIAPEGG
jgi:CBS domain-containing protein